MMKSLFRILLLISVLAGISATLQTRQALAGRPIKLIEPLSLNNPIPQLSGVSHLPLAGRLTFNIIYQSLATVGLLIPPEDWTGRLPLTDHDQEIIVASYFRRFAADSEPMGFEIHMQHRLRQVAGSILPWSQNFVFARFFEDQEDGSLYTLKRFFFLFAASEHISTHRPGGILDQTLRQLLVEKTKIVDTMIKRVSALDNEKGTALAAQLIAVMLVSEDFENTPQVTSNNTQRVSERQSFLTSILVQLAENRQLSPDELHSRNWIHAYQRFWNSFSSDAFEKIFFSSYALLIVSLFDAYNRSSEIVDPTLALLPTGVAIAATQLNKVFVKVSHAMQYLRNKTHVHIRGHRSASNPLLQAMSCKSILR